MKVLVTQGFFDHSGEGRLLEVDMERHIVEIRLSYTPPIRTRSSYSGESCEAAPTMDPPAPRASRREPTQADTRHPPRPERSSPQQLHPARRSRPALEVPPGQINLARSSAPPGPLPA